MVRARRVWVVDLFGLFTYQGRGGYSFGGIWVVVVGVGGLGVMIRGLGWWVGSLLLDGKSMELSIWQGGMYNWRWQSESHESNVT